MPTSRLVRSTTLTLALTAALASVALGAPAAIAAAKSTTASAPVDAAAGGPVDVQIWPGQDGKTAIITVVEVDAKTKLPVTVRIPILPGAKVEWAGEVLGGPASADIEKSYKLIQGQGGQFAEMTLNTSHRGQVDSIGFPLKFTSDSASVEVEYVQTVSSPLTAISVRLPAQTSKHKISPKPEGDPAVNADGETLYTLKPRAFKPGETQKVAISYKTTPPAEKAAGSELNGVLIGLAVALVIAVGATIVIVRRNAPAAAASDRSNNPADNGESEEAGSEDDGSDELSAFDDDEDEPGPDLK